MIKKKENCDFQAIKFTPIRKDFTEHYAKEVLSNYFYKKLILNPKNYEKLVPVLNGK